MVQQAGAQIRAGQCETVTITYGSDLLSRSGRTLGTAGFYREGDTIGGGSMTGPKVRSVGEAEAEQTIAALTLAFATDLAIRLFVDSGPKRVDNSHKQCFLEDVAV